MTKIAQLEIPDCIFWIKGFFDSRAHQCTRISAVSRHNPRQCHSLIIARTNFIAISYIVTAADLHQVHAGT